MNIEKIVKGVIAGSVVIGVFGILLHLNYRNIDEEKEGINLRNSIPVEIKSENTPRDYFELFYKVSKTSDNYKLWKKRFDELNKFSNDGTIIIPVLKQIYYNQGYKARRDSLEKLMIK